MAGLEAGDQMRIFLSHNKMDRDIARRLGAQLVLGGADVWFDEWEMQAGDSIIGKINEGLESFDVFLLLWSENARRSDWVRRELRAAIHCSIGSRTKQVIPCRLDDTPLPPLLSDIRFIDCRDPNKAIEGIVEELLGISGRRSRLIAIQAALDEMDLTWHESPGMNPIICCPRCGREDTIVGWSAADYSRDDLYAGLKCTACGWSDGGEI
ncbi:MAG: toll/interleukin-1 receptor domain-containing protein [Bacillota bacterium]|nr:toll/interleukin-1 receptor domain-containing protein [Bacillota bacterium]